jgi:hypothetical protein
MISNTPDCGLLLIVKLVRGDYQAGLTSLRIMLNRLP